MQRFAEQSRKECTQFSAFPLRLSVFASKFVNFQTDSQTQKRVSLGLDYPKNPHTNLEMTRLSTGSSIL
jgi:hypothetical protein